MDLLPSDTVVYADIGSGRDKQAMSKRSAQSVATSHEWEFRARFRKRAFGWKSQPAVKRVREATAEIRKVARKDANLAAEGAVLFLEKLSPALEQVDSSSGAIGAAVNKAILTLVDIIAAAPADEDVRRKWLDRLYKALEEDDIPYIESLAEHWGKLCATPELASFWADEIGDPTRRALLREKHERQYFFGTSACLSALHAAGRHDELITLLNNESFWPYKRWAVEAMAAQGRKSEALELAESCRSPWASDLEIDRICEALLLSAGLVDEAYSRYGLQANQAGTYAAWFRAVARKYPDKSASVILNDLVATTPEEEGKWFAAAKDAGLYDEAIKLAMSSPASPQTLTRAARDFEEKNPTFAIEAGMAALHWLALGYGYDITSLHVLDAYKHTLAAAEHEDKVEQTKARIREIVASESNVDDYVARVLANQLQ